jgi:hypothetical protein
MLALSLVGWSKTKPRRRTGGGDGRLRGYEVHQRRQKLIDKSLA